MCLYCMCLCVRVCAFVSVLCVCICLAVFLCLCRQDSMATAAHVCQVVFQCPLQRKQTKEKQSKVKQPKAKQSSTRRHSKVKQSKVKQSKEKQSKVVKELELVVQEADKVVVSQGELRAMVLREIHLDPPPWFHRSRCCWHGNIAGCRCMDCSGIAHTIAGLSQRCETQHREYLSEMRSKRNIGRPYSH